MVVLLCAGAAYGLANKGKPKPALSASRKNIALICIGIAVGSFALAAALGLSAHNPVPH
jgi:hypothetical protein